MYLSLGTKLVKIHKILKFKQSDWLKNYIDFYTDKRKNAANSFKEVLFKLMNNNAFGKTMEKLRKGMNVIMLEARDSSFVSQKIFFKNFVYVHEVKTVLTLDKPTNVGFSI